MLLPTIMAVNTVFIIWRNWDFFWIGQPGLLTISPPIHRQIWRYNKYVIAGLWWLLRSMDIYVNKMIVANCISNYQKEIHFNMHRPMSLRHTIEHHIYSMVNIRFSRQKSYIECLPHIHLVLGRRLLVRGCSQPLSCLAWKRFSSDTASTALEIPMFVKQGFE